MSYSVLFSEVAKHAKRVFTGYCRGLNNSECIIKLNDDMKKAFINYSIPISPFLKYPLYALPKNTNYIIGEPIFKGKADLSFVKLDLSHCKNGFENPVFNTSIDNWLYGPGDCSLWPFSMSVGKFYPSSSSNKSGLLTFSPNIPTLGNLNYGYEIENGVYKYYNYPTHQLQEDPDCEDTQSKSDSLYSKKFNCVYGHKYAENVDELEIYSVRNPGFEKDDVFFLEPRIPYQTIKNEEPLYRKEGKFHNIEKERYGIPLTPVEQNPLEENQIQERLVEFCTS